MPHTTKAAKARKQAAPPSPDFDLARLDAEWAEAGRKAHAALAGTIDEPELAHLDAEWQAAGRHALAGLASASITEIRHVHTDLQAENSILLDEMTRLTATIIDRLGYVDALVEDRHDQVMARLAAIEKKLGISK